MLLSGVTPKMRSTFYNRDSAAELDTKILTRSAFSYPGRLVSDCSSLRKLVTDMVQRHFEMNFVFSAIKDEMVLHSLCFTRHNHWILCRVKQIVSSRSVVLTRIPILVCFVSWIVQRPQPTTAKSPLHFDTKSPFTPQWAVVLGWADLSGGGGPSITYCTVYLYDPQRALVRSVQIRCDVDCGGVQLMSYVVYP